MTVSPIPRLRPLGLGELLDQAIRLYRRNFLTFIGIIAVMQIPLTVLQLGASLLAFSGFFAQLDDFSSSPPADPFEIFTPNYFIGIGSSLFLAVVGWLLIKGVATAALTQAVAGSYLGKPIGIIKSYQKIGQSWLPLIGALLLAIVLGIGLFIWFLVPCVGWLTGLGILAFFWMVITPLIAPIIVLEKQPAGQSIRRAWDLARRRFWWVLGFVFILFLFAQLVITGPATLANFAVQFVVGSNPFEPSSNQFVLQSIVQTLVQLFFSLLYIPLQLTAITLMYFDLRVRTEGFDLALLAGGESAAAGATEVMAQAPAPEQTRLVTWTEVGYFALISVGAALLYAIFVAIFGALGMAMMAAFGGFSG